MIPHITSHFAPTRPFPQTTSSLRPTKSLAGFPCLCATQGPTLLLWHDRLWRDRITEWLEDQSCCGALSWRVVFEKCHHALILLHCMRAVLPLQAFTPPCKVPPKQEFIFSQMANKLRCQLPRRLRSRSTIILSVNIFTNSAKQLTLTCDNCNKAFKNTI